MSIIDSRISSDTKRETFAKTQFQLSITESYREVQKQHFALDNYDV